MIEVSGIGLHTGQKATVRFHLEPGPVRFLVGNTVFRPLASHVVDTTRCTVLGTDEARLMTAEHLLAALFIRGVWEGLVMEVSGPEIPILDGSAKEWLEVLRGFQPSKVEPQRLEAPLQLEEGRSSVLAQPADKFSLLVTVAFPHPKIGYQQVESPPVPLTDLAPARTFGFLREVESLRSKGLIKGASLENALVFSDTETLNPPRMVHEPVRHKALDFLGDLYLAGVPYQGRFIVHRGSHRLHVDLAKLLQPPLTELSASVQI